MDETAAPNRRRLGLTGHGTWQERLARLVELDHFLAATDYADAAASYLQGDASTRAYARLVLPDRTAILMDAPRQPDGPPIRDGKPYTTLVHLAEDVTPFVAVGSALRERGLSAPAIYAFDLAQGLLLSGGSGRPSVSTSEAASGRPTGRALRRSRRCSARPQHAAAAHVASDRGTRRLTGFPPLTTTPCSPRPCCSVDWFWPALHGRPMPDDVQADFIALWQPLLREAAKADRGWVLRDYHSPNLMWLPERAGIRRVGILDFQDALAGPAAYDLVSLLQDARLDVPEDA